MGVGRQKVQILLKISVVPGGDRDLRASAVFMAECWGGALPVGSCWIVCD